jgi:hypothetical protein
LLISLFSSTTAAVVLIGLDSPYILLVPGRCSGGVDVALICALVQKCCLRRATFLRKKNFREPPRDEVRRTPLLRRSGELRKNWCVCRIRPPRPCPKMLAARKRAQGARYEGRGRGHLLGPGKGRALVNPIGGRMVSELRDGYTAGAYSVHDNTIPPGSPGPRPHLHRGHPLTYEELEEATGWLSVVLPTFS